MGKITRKELSDELNNELDSYSTKNELQTLDSKVMSHLADLVTDADGAHGLKVEEGTWTPILRNNISSGFSHTYAIQKGWYTRIGNTIDAYFHIKITKKASDYTTGTPLIGGLPFVPKDVLYFPAGILKGLSVTTTETFSAGVMVDAPYPFLKFVVNNTTGYSVVAGVASIADDFEIAGRFTYKI